MDAKHRIARKLAAKYRVPVDEVVKAFNTQFRLSVEAMRAGKGQAVRITGIGTFQPSRNHPLRKAAQQDNQEDE